MGDVIVTATKSPKFCLMVTGFFLAVALIYGFGILPLMVLFLNYVFVENFSVTTILLAVGMIVAAMVLNGMVTGEGEDDVLCCVVAYHVGLSYLGCCATYWQNIGWLDIINNGSLMGSPIFVSAPTLLLIDAAVVSVVCCLVFHNDREARAANTFLENVFLGIFFSIGSSGVVMLFAGLAAMAADPANSAAAVCASLPHATGTGAYIGCPR